jgi:hypothetical protein
LLATLRGRKISVEFDETRDSFIYETFVIHDGRIHSYSASMDNDLVPGKLKRLIINGETERRSELEESWRRAQCMPPVDELP